MTSRRVGFIGLGNMGGRMTRRLASAAYEVLGYDPVAGKATAAGAIPAGVLASCQPGQVIVDLSTAAPSSTIKLHAALAERGAEYLDAGISGGVAAAEKGTLTVMVGGAEPAGQRPARRLRPGQQPRLRRPDQQQGGGRDR